MVIDGKVAIVAGGASGLGRARGYPDTWLTLPRRQSHRSERMSSGQHRARAIRCARGGGLSRESGWCHGRADDALPTANGNAAGIRGPGSTRRGEFLPISLDGGARMAAR